MPVCIKQRIVHRTVTDTFAKFVRTTNATSTHLQFPVQSNFFNILLPTADIVFNISRFLSMLERDFTKKNVHKIRTSCVFCFFETYAFSRTFMRLRNKMAKTTSICHFFLHRVLIFIIPRIRHIKEGLFMAERETNVIQ